MLLSLNSEQFLSLFYLLQSREKMLEEDNVLQSVEKQMKDVLLDLLTDANNTKNIALYEKWKDVEGKKIQNLEQELAVLKNSTSTTSKDLASNRGIFSRKKNKF